MLFVLAILAVPIAMVWRALTFNEDYSYTPLGEMCTLYWIAPKSSAY